MQKFELFLKNEKQKFYDRLTLFIFLINGTDIIWGLASSDQPVYQKISGFISFLLVIAAIGIYLASPKQAKKEYFFLSAATGIILYWIISGNWRIGLAVFVLSVLYIISKRKLVVRTSAAEIQYPSFPKRHITWNEVTHVILKDGLLTIDFRNNRLIQQSIDESKTSVNEKEFNDFCSQQLKASASTIVNP